MVIFTVFTSLYAQNKNTKCTFKFSVVAEQSPATLEYADRFVTFNIDVSKLDASANATLEIVKIFDCFKGLDGTQTEIYKAVNLKEIQKNSKNKYSLKHTEMLAKCFKWRVIIQSQICTEQSNWSYYSYLD